MHSVDRELPIVTQMNIMRATTQCSIHCVADRTQNGSLPPSVITTSSAPPECHLQLSSDTGFVRGAQSGVHCASCATKRLAGMLVQHF